MSASRPTPFIPQSASAPASAASFAPQSGPVPVPIGPCAQSTCSCTGPVSTTPPTSSISRPVPPYVPAIDYPPPLLPRLSHLLIPWSLAVLDEP
ncbi:hypothetical protein ACFX13_029460 [Malus domestica]